MSFRRSARLRNQKRNQNNLDDCGNESVSKKEKDEEKKKKVVTMSQDDYQISKEKSVAEQRQGQLDSISLLEQKSKSLTIQDVVATGLDNTFDAFDSKSNQPSTSKERMAADEKFTTDANASPLSSDIQDLISNSDISKLPLDELMLFYSVEGTDNFDDLDI